MTTICFDFGNTLKKYAFFKDGELIHTDIINDVSKENIDKLLIDFKPERSVLSSVINEDIEIEKSLRAATSFRKLSSSSLLPFTIAVPKAETIGADRLALCAAAVHLYPHQNNLIIAAGSCVTFNFINKYHQFLGGSISPGMGMRLRSLHNFTAKLPLIDPEMDFPFIGYDTKTNILSGVIGGMVLEIDGMIDEYKRKYDNFNVLLTGGDIPYFAQHLKNKIFADPQLIFKGLYAISEYEDVIKT